MKPDGAIAQRLAAVEVLGEYRDLRNPFTDWLHGAFRLATGESNRASDLFRNAVALDDRQNSHALQDLLVAEGAAGSLRGAPARVWIVHEDGIGPHLEEFRFSFNVITRSGPGFFGHCAAGICRRHARDRCTGGSRRWHGLPHPTPVACRSLCGHGVSCRVQRHRRQGCCVDRGQDAGAGRRQRSCPRQGDSRELARHLCQCRHCRDHQGGHAHVGRSASLNRGGQSPASGRRAPCDHDWLERGHRSDVAFHLVRASHREDRQRGSTAGHPRRRPLAEGWIRWPWGTPS